MSIRYCKIYGGIALFLSMSFAMTNHMTSGSSELTLLEQPIKPDCKQSAVQEIKSTKTGTGNQDIMILCLWKNSTHNEYIEGVRIDSSMKSPIKISMRANLLKMVRIGDIIQLPVIGNGNKYLLNVTDIKTIRGYKMVVTGEFVEQDKTYMSTISIKNDSIMAFLNIPEGSYYLKTVNGKGVIYQSP